MARPCGADSRAARVSDCSAQGEWALWSLGWVNVLARADVAARVGFRWPWKDPEGLPTPRQ